MLHLLGMPFGLPTVLPFAEVVFAFVKLLFVAREMGMGPLRNRLPTQKPRPPNIQRNLGRQHLSAG